MSKTEFRNVSTQKIIEEFNQVALYSKEELKKNPFSTTYKIQQFNKSAKDYGRPTIGSKTEERAHRAGNYVVREIIFLCEIIRKNCDGEPPNAIIKFGRLFSIYSHYSDKLVGMLIRARKYGLLTFEGEMLYQRQDDNKEIRLLKDINEINRCVQYSGDPVNCISIEN